MRITIELDAGPDEATRSLTLTADEAGLPQPTGGRDDALATDRIRQGIARRLIQDAARAAVTAFDLDTEASYPHGPAGQYDQETHR